MFRHEDILLSGGSDEVEVEALAEGWDHRGFQAGLKQAARSAEAHIFAGMLPNPFCGRAFRPDLRANGNAGSRGLGNEVHQVDKGLEVLPGEQLQEISATKLAHLFSRRLVSRVFNIAKALPTWQWFPASKAIGDCSLS